MLGHDCHATVVIAAKFLLWLETARPVISQECQATEDIGSQMFVL